MRGLLQHWTKSFVDQVSNLPATKETVLLLDLLFLQTDSSLEVRIMNISGSLGPMILSRTMPTHSLSVMKWWYSGIRLKVGRNSIVYDKNPTWCYLGGLYKLRIREFEKLKTVLELFDLEIHQKKLGLDYQRLKTMVKRSIEQDIGKKNFGARNGNYEKNAVVKNQGTKQRVQILGDCWQWETNGQCIDGVNCSFRHDINKRGKVTQSNTSPNSFMQQNERPASRTRSPRGKSPSGRMSRWLCKDYLKEFAITHFVIGGTLQDVCSTRPRVVAEWFKWTLPGRRTSQQKVQEEWLQEFSSVIVQGWVTWCEGATRCLPWHPSRERPRICWVQFIEYTTIGLRRKGV